jgi:transposase
LHEESVKAPQVIEFLKHLQRHIKGKLLVIRDNLPAHRPKVVAEYLATTKGRVWVERLPDFAPEPNPIESLWGYAKSNELANLAPKDLRELSRLWGSPHFSLLRSDHRIFQQPSPISECCRLFGRAGLEGAKAECLDLQLGD